MEKYCIKQDLLSISCIQWVIPNLPQFFSHNCLHKLLLAVDLRLEIFIVHSLTLPLLSMPSCPAAVLYIASWLVYVVCQSNFSLWQNVYHMMSTQHKHNFTESRMQKVETPQWLASVLINGSAVKAKAGYFIMCLNMQNFHCPDGWCHYFKGRRRI
jgi:hypothetical protein